MRRFLAPLAIVLGLVVATPLAVNAQQPKQGKGAPARGHGGHGAARGGGHPAPRVSVPHRAAPHFSAPHRAVAPRYTPHRAVAPHHAPRRAATPHYTPHRAATPHRRAPSVSRSAPRHERAVRHREERARHRVQPTQPTVRSTTRTPPAATGTQRREEFRRHERATRRNGAQPSTLAQPNAAVMQRHERAQRRAMRHHRPGAVTPLAARSGRFASPYSARARSAAARRARRYHYAARRAWRRGLRAAFIPWYGPVFWPYVYSDIFYYTFWPYGYEEGYWAYAYDDFIDSLFWGPVGPPDEYLAYAPAAPPRARRAAVEELCREPGTGITAWPFREMERKLDLTSDQRALLDDVRTAADKATAIFKASCPAGNAYPLTPPGRLRAMTARLQATLDAVRTVRPPLERFYNSLSDEQKERFNELGPTKLRRSPEVTAALPEDAKTCTQAKPGLTNLPIEQIDAVVVPDEDQEKLLDSLADATDKAVAILQAACPAETPLTPPGRLAAMETRLQAMIDAANTVRPALDDFYASLSNEQKARFNRIGRELAKSGG